MAELPSEARARLLKEQVDQHRAAARARAAGGRYEAPETVASRQAMELAAAPRAIPPAGPVAVASELPDAARLAIEGKFDNPPVHRAQIRPIPGVIDAEGFLRFVSIIPALPKLSQKTMIAVARVIVWLIGKARTPDEAVPGVAQGSYDSIATAARCSRAQVWRALRLFKARGILDIFNVLDRVDGRLVRSPNAYVLRGFTKAVPKAAQAVKDAVTGAYDRVREQVRRFAAIWDMTANHLSPRVTQPPRKHLPPA